MSEQGHIAGVCVLMIGKDASEDITHDYNLREDLLAGESLRTCKQEMRRLYKRLKASVNAWGI